MALTAIGFKGQVDEGAWANLTASTGCDYSIVGADDFAVTIDVTLTRTVRVAAGQAYGHGVLVASDAETILTSPVVSSGTTRWDTVVLRRKWGSSPELEVKVLTGNGTRAIATSRKSTPGIEDEQPLALIQVSTSSTAILSVVDLRVWTTGGGAKVNTLDALAYLTRVGTQVTLGSTIHIRHGSGWVEAVPGTWPVARGGTGATTAASARLALGAHDAANLSTGTVPLARIPALDAGRIPALDASKITGGVLSAARIPPLDASKITAGTATRPVTTTGYVQAGALRANNSLEIGTLPGVPSAIWGAAVLKASGLEFNAPGTKTIGTGAGLGDVVINGGGHALAVRSDYLSSSVTYDRTYSSPANGYVTVNGIFGRTTSSRRYKEDIADAPRLPSVLDIQARTWIDKAQKKRTLDAIADGTIPEGWSVETLPRHYGAIAEELHDLGLEQLVVYDDEGRPDAISEVRIVYALIPEVRENRERIVELENDVQELREALSSIQEALGILP